MADRRSALPIPTWQSARASLARAIRDDVPPERVETLRAEFAVARLAHLMDAQLLPAPPLSRSRLRQLHDALDATQDRGQ